MQYERLRQQQVSRMRLRIERESFPRLQMFFLVSLTGAAGFLASFSLLAAGMASMSTRYPVAVGIAYLVFLFLLWLWLRTSAGDYADLADPSLIPAPRRSSAAAREDAFAGKGGEADGGGASGNFVLPDEASACTTDLADPVGEALGTAAQAEEFAIPLVAIVLAAAIALSSVFVIYSAPLLFAELLIDATLAASLYRRLRGIDARHWLETAVRRTALPFLITAGFSAAIGWGLHTYAPGANSVGKAIVHLKQGS
ncbi:MAG TPA: hypothetical protein VEB70_04560 [Noviherbaspirillum sp.]|nr:hypothetical protein [Noviherbaspirillum sp.]